MILTGAQHLRPGFFTRARSSAGPRLVALRERGRPEPAALKTAPLIFPVFVLRLGATMTMAAFGNVTGPTSGEADVSHNPYMTPLDRIQVDSLVARHLMEENHE
ncbi:MAG: hypothetical protein KKB02_06895 [Alphaproteobacteria bacterium]|nr:hypothetical protein [Alphaproteobacteria bacterium]